MPDGGGNTGGGLYDQIKQFLPVAADAAIGGLIGGPAGAIAGAAGAGQAEYKAEEFGQQQQDKMMQVMSLMEERKARHEEALQRLEDQKEWHTQQGLFQQQRADEEKRWHDMTDQGRKDTLDERRSHDTEMELLRGTALSLAGGKNIGDSDYEALIKAGGPGWEGFAGVKSPKLRELVASRILTAKGAASDVAINAAWKTIADRSYGGDLEKAMADPDLATRSGPELVRLAHSAHTKDLSSPDKLKKEAAADDKEAKALVGDLEGAHEKWRKNDAWLKGALSTPESEAAGTIKYLKSWSNLTPEEQAKDRKILIEGYRHNLAFGDIAKLMRPTTTPLPKLTPPDGATPKDAALREQVLKAFDSKGVRDPNARRKMLRDMGLPEEWASAAKAETPRAAFKAGDTRDIGGVTYKRDDKGAWTPVK